MKRVVPWACAIAVAAGLLVATDYHSRDPDSALYARLAAGVAKQPPHRWIAPEWGGAWNTEGPFKEHPVGILIPPVLLIRAGFPAGQAPYAVNMLYQVAVILLIPAVAALVVKTSESRPLAWLLQLIPVAFVYRIRANQEHPLLMCFLAMLYATARARQQPAWIGLTIVAFCALVLIKAAFAMFAVAGAALWLLLVPAPPGGSDRWAWLGLAAALAAAALVAVAYEAAYVRVTGESFLAFYGSTRLGASIRLSDTGLVSHALVNIWWYFTRLLWFAAPWSLCAVGVLIVSIRRRRLTTPLVDLRAAVWAFVTAAVYIVVLSPALVRAERFIFPTYFAIGALGAIAAMRTVGWINRVVTWTNRREWVAVAVWMVAFLLSLGSRLIGS
jgi:Dolichyl-phosphate-mannose-protein mannosyltransferase